MPTNQLAADMCNMPLNISKRERTLWGQLAFQNERSTGDFMRQVLLAGLEKVNTAAAAELKAIRTERLRLKHGIVCLAAGLLVVALSLTGTDFDLRKGRTSRPSIAKSFGKRKEVA